MFCISMRPGYYFLHMYLVQMGKKEVDETCIRQQNAEVQILTLSEEVYILETYADLVDITPRPHLFI